MSFASLMHYAPAAVLGAALSLIPIRGRRWVGLAGLLAGIFAAPYLLAALPAASFTLIQIALYRLAFLRALRVGSGVLALLALGGLAFEAAALGLGPIDPYDFGFHPRGLLAVLTLLGGFWAWRGERAALALLGADLLAYGAGLYDNLFDALFDPVLILLALAVLGLRLNRSLRAEKIA